MNPSSRPDPQTGLTLELIRGELPEDLDTLAQAVADNPYACLVAARAFFAELVPHLHHLVVRIDGQLAGILSFHRRRSTLVVVNECVSLPASALASCVDHLFAEYDGVTRVAFTKVSESDESSVPPRMRARRICRGIDNYVLRLPASVEEYAHTFVPRTRQKMRNHERRLLKELPGSRFAVFERDTIEPRLIDAIVALNHARMRVKGGESLIDASFAAGLRSLSRACGVVCTYLDGERVAAGAICAKVGSGWSIMVIAHDPAFDRLSLGALCLLRTVETAIRDHASVFNMMWGKSEYKTRFGAHAIPLCDRYYYRNRWAYLLDSGIVLPVYEAAARAAAHRLRRRLHLGRFVRSRRMAPDLHPDDVPLTRGVSRRDQRAC